jgi:hypothetical protein
MNLLFEIDEYPGYFVGTDLNIYSEKQGSIKMMTPGTDTGGYYMIGFMKDGKKHTNIFHRLIAEMFIPNPNNMKFIDHINGNRQDNRLENLRWVTRSVNNRNARIYKNNTTEYQGVQYHKRDKSWVARWSTNQSIRNQKSFSIKKYGDNAKQLAIDFRKMKVDEFYNRPK